MHRNGLSHRQQNGMFSHPSSQSRFPAAANGAQPGRPAGPSKPRPTGSNGFSHMAGLSQQPRGSIDLSEFPQLSSGARLASNSAIWSNPTIRAPPASSSKPGSDPAGLSLLGQADPLRQLTSVNPSAEDYRFGSRPDPRTIGPASGLAAQTVPDATIDFPPLTGLGSSEVGADRRIAAGLGRITTSSVPESRSSLADAPVEPGQSIPPGAAPAAGPTDGQTGSDAGRPGEMTAHEVVAAMPERARYSMPGLQVAMTDSNYFRSHNLASFGFDLDSSNHTPLHLSFGSLFSDPRRNIPEFHLPATYNVTNVPPLAKRTSTFSDDTLFAIFYQYPRDYLQELAAVELYGREWRWHREMKRWLRKDSAFPAPVPINAREERGIYIVFDVEEWQKETRELVINYSHLETRQLGAPATTTAATTI